MELKQRNFSSALGQQYNTGKIAVIPDIKMRSPAQGDLIQGRDPEKLARTLAAAGAPVLSVVTEPKYFAGTPKLLQQIVQATELPVLRKDFIKSKAQLLESKNLGASAVLLITSILEKEQLFQLVEEALNLGLEVLVETHNQEEIIVANELSLPMIGINNRNILQLEKDEGNVNTTEKLIGLVRAPTLVISESAIASSDDVQRAAAAGAHAVLVGTAILQAQDPGEMYQKLSQARGKSYDPN